jgi:sugar O-acyltransferase (sialic acid O-acetyltransferase NeuD family)
VKKLLIVGAGGHGKAVADAAEAMGIWSEIAFVDDNKQGQVIGGYPVLASSPEQMIQHKNYENLVVAVGNNHLRLQLLEKYKSLGFCLPVIIHSQAYVNKHAKIADGSVVFAKAVVNVDSKVGVGCIINSGAIVEHDCELKDGVHISPNAALAGGVKIGEKSWVGIGANVIENIVIGKQVTVGAGAVVINNILDCAKVVGVPAKEVEFV